MARTAKVVPGFPQQDVTNSVIKKQVTAFVEAVTGEAFVNQAFIRQIAHCNVNQTVHRMSVFKNRDTVSLKLAMMENMVTFATWNVLVLAVNHVIEEMEYVGSVQNIGLALYQDSVYMEVTTANMAEDVARIVRAGAGLVTIHQFVWNVQMDILANHVLSIVQK
uniref:Uncharacterized protein n=1 Tax=Magallana gigas TaxID=29159 RepID=A0A8W8KHQ0_MAGGI